MVPRKRRRLGHREPRVSVIIEEKGVRSEAPSPGSVDLRGAAAKAGVSLEALREWVENKMSKATEDRSREFLKRLNRDLERPIPG